MVGGKQIGGTSPGRKDQGGLGMKSEAFQTQDGYGVMIFLLFFLVVRVRTIVVATTVYPSHSVEP